VELRNDLQRELRFGADTNRASARTTHNRTKLSNEKPPLFNKLYVNNLLPLYVHGDRSMALGRRPYSTLCPRPPTVDRSDPVFIAEVRAYRPIRHDVASTERLLTIGVRRLGHEMTSATTILCQAQNASAPRSACDGSTVCPEKPNACRPSHRYG
jgi:hypothetical protein